MKLHKYSTNRLDPNRIPSLRIKQFNLKKIGLGPSKPPIPGLPGRNLVKSVKGKKNASKDGQTI